MQSPSHRHPVRLRETHLDRCAPDVGDDTRQGALRFRIPGSDDFLREPSRVPSPSGRHSDGRVRRAAPGTLRPHRPQCCVNGLSRQLALRPELVAGASMSKSATKEPQRLRVARRNGGIMRFLSDVSDSIRVFVADLDTTRLNPAGAAQAVAGPRFRRVDRCSTRARSPRRMRAAVISAQRDIGQGRRRRPR